jgi:hypothetical protein
MDQETAKIASQLLPALRDALGNVPSDLVGLLGGDLLRHARIRNWSKLEEKTRRILKERGVNEDSIGEVSPAIFIPIVTTAADENREELLELWSKLLAAAADPARCNAVRKSFVSALRDFDPIDALVFHQIWKTSGGGSPTMRDYIAGILQVGTDSVTISFENLARLQCVANPQAGALHPGNDPSLTSFGRELSRVLFG